MILLVPNIYQRSIYTIDYRWLYKEKMIRLLLFDLDNTCVGYREKLPSWELKKLFKKLTKMGFQVIIFSNATRRRVRPFTEIGVLVNANSKKPFSYSFKKVLRKYNYQPEEVCMIGDQLFTDIFGGNRVGIMTCLVDPITNQDFVLTKVLRLMEKICYCNLHKKGLLTRGEYYD